MPAADPTTSPVLWTGLDALPDMDEAQFNQWAALLKERTGMFMPKERKSFLVTSVGLRMRELGYEDYASYYEYLTSGLAGNIEWTALVDRLTVHETRFFRDPKAVEFVEQDVLPRIVERVRAGGSAQIWSAGCSTGEEAFTLAMLIDDALRKAEVTPLFGVTGTDISLYSLATAKQGMYHERRLRHIPEDYQKRYCQLLDSGGFKMADDLRRRVCFAQLNILEASSAPVGSMDLIFCQNVLIYFDKETRFRILDGLVRPLRQGGTLVLGAGEVIGWNNPIMQRAGGTNVLAFQRVSE